MQALTSWLPIEANSDFSLHNLPFGIFQRPGHPARVGVALGDYVIDLYALSELGYLMPLKKSPGFEEALIASVLNPLMALGTDIRVSIRAELQAIFSEEPAVIERASLENRVLVPRSQVNMLMPVDCRDYTDFYSSRQHAYNVGVMFRGPENALMPNYLHLPVGYHGRASSIQVSGTDFYRPMGQRKPADAALPVFGASQQMDFELEMAFVIGKGNELGSPIKIEDTWSHIWGFVIFNDWSARDIQSWEYVPLGPFLGKNFGSVISPWLVTPEALAPFRIKGPTQEPEVLPYLQDKAANHLDIALEVILETSEGVEQVISQSNMKHLYWSVTQQLAHHTVNGCNMNIGDICASGTISAPEKSGFGSMLELTWRGTEPITLADGSQRKFIEDGDTIIMRAYCEKDGYRIGFGEVRSTILPAKSY